MPEISVEEVRRFMEECLKAVGTPDAEAEAQASLLLHADTTGHFSHGLNRLAFYINDIRIGATNPKAKPKIISQAAGTAWVDGGDALGATVATFCMDLAMAKAKEAGIGLVSANSKMQPFWWAQKAQRQGLIGLAFTNSSPLLVPTRAKKAALGTNPVAMFAPAAGDDCLGVDMASTAVALGKVEVQVHKEEPIPVGWALGPDGLPTTDAKLALKTGKLMPLGGLEQTSGYKGYALSALIEVLCSGLSGSNATYDIRPWSTDGTCGSPNLGQCFIAIDPGRFAPGFEDRTSGLLQHLRGLEPVDPSLPVLAPGDKERQNAAKTLSKGVVTYTQNLIDLYAELAVKLGVESMRIS